MWSQSFCRYIFLSQISTSADCELYAFTKRNHPSHLCTVVTLLPVNLQYCATYLHHFFGGIYYYVLNILFMNTINVKKCLWPLWKVFQATGSHHDNNNCVYNLTIQVALLLTLELAYYVVCTISLTYFLTLILCTTFIFFGFFLQPTSSAIMAIFKLHFFPVFFSFQIPKKKLYV